MTIDQIKTAISKMSTVDEQDAADIVGLLLLNFRRGEVVAESLLDAFMSIEAHIDGAKASAEAEAYHGSKDHRADLRDEAISLGA